MLWSLEEDSPFKIAAKRHKSTLLSRVKDINTLNLCIVQAMHAWRLREM